MKWLVCKHTLGSAVACGDMVVPQEHDITVVGQKRKTGRPKKNVTKYQEQPAEEQIGEEP